MQLDFNLLGQAPRINTPFENLDVVLRARAAQDAAAGLREQRQAMADEHRQKAEAARIEAQQAAQVRALFSRPQQAPTPEELASVIGPEKATEIFKGFSALQKSQWDNQQDATQGLASILGGIESLPEPLRAGSYAGARQNLIAKGLIKPDDAPEKYDGSWVSQQRKAALTALQQFEQEKPPADYTLGDARMSGATNQMIATAPPKPEKVTYGAPQTQMVNGRRSLVRPGSDGRIYDMNLKPVDAGAIAPEPKDTGSAAQEPLVAIMGPDGRPVLVRRSQAEGKTPASNREQGRAVTSGDAGRISDLDTSLNDLDVLEKTLGTTGAGSKVGAILPNVVTEVTGWGADSKARQGTIDRVKQVIGKALEGGVLRKEDEIKYEKILPTIGDPPSVAKAKLQGLKQALVLRRQTTLDALADAGYETSKFNERGAPKTPSVAPAAGRVRVVGPNGETGTVPDGTPLPAGWKRAG